MHVSRRQFVVGGSALWLSACGGGSGGSSAGAGGTTGAGGGLTGSNNGLVASSEIKGDKQEICSINGSGNNSCLAPTALAVAPNGDIYVVEKINHAIRKLSADGSHSVWAGQLGVSGHTDGSGTVARFLSPTGITLDNAGNAYVCDTDNNTIRRITPSGEVSTLAGQVGVSGHADLIGTAATFAAPCGLTCDGSANLYVAEINNHIVRKIDLNTLAVSTLAGVAENRGFADGAGAAAIFNSPSDITMSQQNPDFLYVADSQNQVIRQIKISTREVITLAGQVQEPVYRDGTGSAAGFYNPSAVVVDDHGHVYVADTDSQTVRLLNVATREVRTVADPSQLARGVNFTPSGVALDKKNHLFVADSDGFIRQLNLD